MWAFASQSPVPQRTAIVPPVDPQVDYSQNAPVNALATFEMYLRDALDFYIDMTAWLASNGPATLATATWASVGAKTPTLTGATFLATGLAGVTITPAVGALPGDAYLLEVTFTIAAIVSAGTTLSIPVRKITRRINVILVNG